MSEGNSYIRWQNIRIAQLGFANHLFIVLAVALLGFILEFIQQKDLVLSTSQKFLFWLGCLFILSSISLGLLVILIRLQDFKLTAQIARKREKQQKENIAIDREKAKQLGKRSWLYFRSQIFTFFISFLNLLIFVLTVLKDTII